MPQKCVGGRGCARDPVGGDYSAPCDLLAEIEGRVNKGMGGKEGESDGREKEE